MANEKRLIDANALLAELDKFVNPMPNKSGYDFLCGIATAITEIEDAPTVDALKWISVKDRLPEKNIRVLVWMQDMEEGYTQIDTDRFSCTMEHGYHWIRWGKNVTHWMPLPQPPKGE